MSNDQLSRIEDKLDGIVAGQAALAQGQGGLERRQAKLEEGQAGLEQRQAKLEQGQAKLEQGQAKLVHGIEEVQTHLIRVDTRLDKLEVNAVAMRDDIKQIAEGHAVTQAAIARSTETVIAHIDQRIDPIELAVKALFGTR